MPHYWRGVFDGDGGIHNGRKRSGCASWLVELFGNKFMVDGFIRFVQKTTHERGKRRRRHSIFAVTYRRLRIVQTLCRVMWANATVFLERKKKRRSNHEGQQDVDGCDMAIT